MLELLPFPSFVMLIISICVFFAAMIRGFTGFGLSALIVGSCSLLIAPSVVVPVALTLEVVASMYMLPKVWKDIQWKLLGLIFIGSIVGTPFGQAILAYFDATTMQLVLGLFILLLSLLIWFNVQIKNHNSFIIVLIGCMAGLANGMAAVGGLVTVIGFLSINLPSKNIRATLVALFFVMNIMGLGFAYNSNMLDWQFVNVSIWMIPSLLIGITLGQAIYARSSADGFRKCVLILLFSLAGLNIIQPWIA